MIGSSDRESVEHWGSVRFSHSVVCFDGHYEVRGERLPSGPTTMCLQSLLAEWSGCAFGTSAQAPVSPYLPSRLSQTLRFVNYPA